VKTLLSPASRAWLVRGDGVLIRYRWLAGLGWLFLALWVILLAYGYITLLIAGSGFALDHPFACLACVGVTLALAGWGLRVAFFPGWQMASPTDDDGVSEAWRN
jgi:hypothetical protein